MSGPPPPFLVGITGGTGSGKTTLAEGLGDRLGRERITLVCQDAYYLDRSDVPAAARAAINFDVPEALDLDGFREDLRRLREGLPIRPPCYSFETHTRTGRGPEIAPREVVLVDGLLLLAGPGLRELFDLTIFLDAPSDVRLARRVDRDVAMRGRTVTSVLAQFRSSVQPAHERWVEPTRSLADLVVANMGALEECVEQAARAIAARLRDRDVQAGAGRRADQ